MTKRSFSCKTLLLVVVPAILLTGSLVLHYHSVVKAQGTCTALDTSPYGAWIQGTAATPTIISVYLDNSGTGWSSTQIDNLKTAFSNWSTEAAQGATGCNCHVIFSYSNTDVNGANTFRVLRQVPTTNSTNRGEFHNTGINAQGRLTSAYIEIHPDTTAAGALTRVMSHEIEHTFGLAHCSRFV
jgi:hypothetical protein